MKQISWTQLFADLRNTESIDRAVRAASKIDMAADEAHLPDLYALLEDDSFFIRELVASPIARLEGVKALPALLLAMIRGEQDGHDNDSLCAVVVELLEKHKREATPILLQMLEDADEARRKHAAWGLGYVVSEISPDPLIRVLANDPSPAVRADAAGALGSFEHTPEVVDELLKIVDDEDEGVRISAISSLGYLGDKRAIQPLREALQDPSERVREIAEYGLKRLKVHL